MGNIVTTVINVTPLFSFADDKIASIKRIHTEMLTVSTVVLNVRSSGALIIPLLIALRCSPGSQFRDEDEVLGCFLYLGWRQKLSTFREVTSITSTLSYRLGPDGFNTSLNNYNLTRFRSPLSHSEVLEHEMRSDVQKHASSRKYSIDHCLTLD